MSKQSPDDLDSTDELPVLLDTVALGDDAEPLYVAPRADDTAQHTALHGAASEDVAGSTELRAELAKRAENIAALETQLRGVADLNRTLEERLAEKDRVIGELKRTAATLRRSAEDTTAAERQLAAQLTVRDERLVELTTTVERLHQEAASRAAELERQRAAAEAARRQVDARSSEGAKAIADATARDLQELREENAALAAYIEGRRSWWDQLAARVAPLEQELTAATKRLEAADALAARESSRAVALRAELAAYARRVEVLERESRLARETEQPANEYSPGAREPAPVPSESATLRPSAAPADTVVASPPHDAPVLTDAVGAVSPGTEAIAQLEAEVEYKRQQVAAQLVELRDREQRLDAATNEVEQVRRELGTLRTELEESRAAVARLERAVIDKDRALGTRDARIAALHEELQERHGTFERQSASDFRLPRPDSPVIGHAGAADGTDNEFAPALLCLTGDAPRRFALTKKSITVGRGPQCDLQILTHFVSREHARITSSGGVTTIEDLGSRNGVFVNSVRIDRRALQQGDLVTIGETQFRFVESMAH